MGTHGRAAICASWRNLASPLGALDDSPHGQTAGKGNMTSFSKHAVIVFATLFVEHGAVAFQTTGFHLDGELNWMWTFPGRTNTLGTFPARTDVLPSERYSFHVVKQACHWQIKASPLGLPGEVYCIGCDGANLYQFCTFAPQASIAMAPNSLKNSPQWSNTLHVLKSEEASQSGAVYPELLPHNDPGNCYVNLIWLAFCSDCFITNHAAPEQLLPLGIFSVVEQTTNNFGKAVLAWGENNNTLSALYLLGSTYAKTPDGQILMFPPPYDKEYTNFAFTVVSCTNWQGVRIPTEFRMSWFAKDFTGPAYPVYRIDGIVTNFVPVSGAETGIPKITRRMHVRDFRSKSLYGVPVVEYDTNPKLGWLDPRSRAYRNVAKGLRMEGARPDAKLYFIIGIIILGIAYGFLTARSRPKSKQQQQ